MENDKWKMENEKWKVENENRRSTDYGLRATTTSGRADLSVAVNPLTRSAPGIRAPAVRRGSDAGYRRSLRATK
jgi:hypothetical protein